MGSVSMAIRDGAGVLVVLGALGALFCAVLELRNRDYVAGMLLVATGLSLLRGGMELLRPSIGE